MTNCPHEVDFAEKLATLEQRSKSNTHRLDELDAWRKDQSALISSVATLAREQKHIKSDVEEIKTDVKAIAEKPGKRWDAIVDKIIMLLVGAAVAYILTGVGL